jgi:hypothetical protein
MDSGSYQGEALLNWRRGLLEDCRSKNCELC